MTTILDRSQVTCTTFYPPYAPSGSPVSMHLTHIDTEIKVRGEGMSCKRLKDDLMEQLAAKVAAATPVAQTPEPLVSAGYLPGPAATTTPPTFSGPQFGVSQEEYDALKRECDHLFLWATKARRALSAYLHDGHDPVHVERAYSQLNRALEDVE